MSREEFEAKKAAQKQLAVEKTANEAGVPYEGFYSLYRAVGGDHRGGQRATSSSWVRMASGQLTGAGRQTTKVLTHTKVPVLVTC
jgi:hypothetical protein